MIPTSNRFKVCWLKKKMLLSPIFGSDTLNFTKGTFTGHELGVYYKKHSRTNYYCLEKNSFEQIFHL